MSVRPFSASRLAAWLTLSLAGVAFGQAADNQQLEEIVVTAKRLDTARDSIAPSLGASDYVIDRKAIENTPQGVDASFNQVLLQAPGMTQDSYGQLHLRNEHGNLQYRINGVVLPEGVSGFGQALDPRLAESIDLITGTLPAPIRFTAPPASSISRPAAARSMTAAASACMAAATAHSNRPSPRTDRRAGSITLCRAATSRTIWASRTRHPRPMRSTITRPRRMDLLIYRI